MSELSEAWGEAAKWAERAAMALNERDRLKHVLVQLRDDLARDIRFTNLVRAIDEELMRLP
jgi:hypothetical protein